MLFSPVFASPHLRPFAASPLLATSRIERSSPLISSIFRLYNSFRMSAHFARFSPHLSPFRMNTSGSVHSKQLYLPLESTLMKKGGRGVQLLLTRNPKEDFCPERPSGEKDLSSNSKIEDSGLVGKDFYPEGVLRPRDLSRYPTAVSCRACPDLVGEDHRAETRIPHPGGSSLRATDCHQRLTERSTNLTQLTALKPGHKMLATWLPIPQASRDGRDRVHFSCCYSSFPRFFLPRRKKRRFSLSLKLQKRFACLRIPACPAA